VELQDRKLSWKYDGNVTVGDDGLLTIVFGDGGNNPALISYAVITPNHGR
jgi:hypothetical protein